MGWWDLGIMGGDTPYDVAAVAGDLLDKKMGVRPWADWHAPASWSVHSRARVRMKVEKFGGANTLLLAVENKCLDETSRYTFKHWVVLEVIGLMMMSAGVRLDALVRRKVLTAIDDEIAAIPESGWDRPHERVAALTELKGMLQKYDGTPVTLAQTGLVERLCSPPLPKDGIPRVLVVAKDGHTSYFADKGVSVHVIDLDDGDDADVPPDFAHLAAECSELDDG